MYIVGRKNNYLTNHNFMENNHPKPKNYLVESILATIFCCLPLGIVGIINASKVNSAYDQGNYEEAERAAADAKKWTKIAFIVGIVLGILSVVINVLGFGAAILGGGSY